MVMAGVFKGNVTDPFSEHFLWFDCCEICTVNVKLKKSMFCSCVIFLQHFLANGKL